MKTLAVILGVVLTTLFGCKKQESIAHDVSEIIVIDSTGIYEDINNPGLFLTAYDTLVLTIDTEYNVDSQQRKIVYSARRK